MVLFSGYQDGSVTSNAILGHISPSSFPCSLAFRATIHSRFMTFRVIMSHFQFGVQSHFSNFASSEPPSFLSFNVQSHHFSVSAFRAIIITSQFRHSKPSLSLFNFGVQSHHYRFLVSAFRAVVTSQIDVQSRIFSFGSWEPPMSRFLVSPFKAIIIS